MLKHLFPIGPALLLWGCFGTSKPAPSTPRPEVPQKSPAPKTAVIKKQSPKVSKPKKEAAPKKATSAPLPLKQVCAVKDQFKECRQKGISLVHISEGEEGGCALSKKGRVYCWGDGTTGRLGTGCSGPKCKTDFLTPVAFPEEKTISSLSCSPLFCCAADTQGEAWCWGGNSEHIFNYAPPPKRKRRGQPTCPTRTACENIGPAECETPT